MFIVSFPKIHSHVFGLERFGFFFNILYCEATIQTQISLWKLRVNACYCPNCYWKTLVNKNVSLKNMCVLLFVLLKYLHMRSTFTSQLLVACKFSEIKVISLPLLSLSKKHKWSEFKKSLLLNQFLIMFKTIKCMISC